MAAAQTALEAVDNAVAANNYLDILNDVELMNFVNGSQYQLVMQRPNQQRSMSPRPIGLAGPQMARPRAQFWLTTRRALQSCQPKMSSPG